MAARMAGQNFVIYFDADDAGSRGTIQVLDQGASRQRAVSDSLSSRRHRGWRSLQPAPERPGELVERLAQNLGKISSRRGM